MRMVVILWTALDIPKALFGLPNDKNLNLADHFDCHQIGVRSTRMQQLSYRLENNKISVSNLSKA
jgi:hypothetical protein